MATKRDLDKRFLRDEYVIEFMEVVAHRAGNKSNPYRRHWQALAEKLGSRIKQHVSDSRQLILHSNWIDEVMSQPAKTGNGHSNGAQFPVVQSQTKDWDIASWFQSLELEQLDDGIAAALHRAMETKPDGALYNAKVQGDIREVPETDDPNAIGYCCPEAVIHDARNEFTDIQRKQSKQSSRRQFPRGRYHETKGNHFRGGRH